LLSSRERREASGGTEKDVAALEQQWLQSQETNNPDLVAPLLADKFITTGSDGKVNNKPGPLSKKRKRSLNDSPDLRLCLYQIFFLQDNASGMAQQLAWLAGNPDFEDQMLSSQAYTAAYFGRLKEARQFSRRAVASAERSEKKETAAGYETAAAAMEAAFGNAAEARQRAEAALALSKGRDVQMLAAFALGAMQSRHKHSLMTWQSTSRKTR
jgi:hypothetical protein